LGRLPSELETAIFRIVQECLGNVHRHSGSATASIHLSITNSQIHLEVRDEGSGIPPEKQQELKSGMRAGVGLRSMQERVAQFQGELQIQSNPDGTTVRALLPCNPSVYAEAG
jgi:signal transduction histidine kinase